MFAAERITKLDEAVRPKPGNVHDSSRGVVQRLENLDVHEATSAGVRSHLDSLVAEIGHYGIDHLAEERLDVREIRVSRVEQPNIEDIGALNGVEHREHVAGDFSRRHTPGARRKAREKRSCLRTTLGPKPDEALRLSASKLGDSIRSTKAIATTGTKGQVKRNDRSTG